MVKMVFHAVMVGFLVGTAWLVSISRELSYGIYIFGCGFLVLFGLAYVWAIFETLNRETSQETDAPSESEEKRILRLANERIAEAKLKGLDTIIIELYGECRCYPGWTQNCPQDVPDFVTRVQEQKIHENLKTTVFHLHQDRCEFRYRTGDWQSDASPGTLELVWNDKTVFSIAVRESYVNEAVKIEGYIPGDWEPRIIDFHQWMNARDAKKREEDEAKKEQEKLEAMKRNFNL